MTDRNGDAGVDVIDPSTGQVIEHHEYTTQAELDRILDGAASVASEWALSDIDTRVAFIRRLAELLREGRETFARQIVSEMGKPFSQAEAEIDKSILTCDFYAEQLPGFLEPESVDLGGDLGLVAIRPLGVVLAILPWNYPWWQVVRAMLPAIAAGNAVVLKHADSVTGCAKEIERVFTEAAGLGILRTVVLPPEGTSALIDAPQVAAVTFTGSDRIGALVASRAGAVVKKCVLELGGSDPFIVLADADLETAAAAAVRSRFSNNGQSCIAAKRLLVHEAVFGDFIDALTPLVARLRVGDPMDPETDIGPIARADLRQTLARQQAKAAADGDRLLATASKPDGPGEWFAPAIFEPATADSVLLRDEAFGPLGAVTSAADDDALIRLANDSRFGLSSSLWTRDTDKALVLTRRIEAGAVFINGISATDPRLPTGGIKASGYGRELGHWGLTEFANVQAIRVHR
ncbi:aldehyde dehydrogenase family protein [Microbacterium sp. 22303]|uniref:aldehyde dehydrogenase family protein n=1 Tax=Microbacterium sp. 22303 TaxID=3453905 RepID=UPI003F87A6B9